jgi:hypothetical protein
MWPGGFSRKQLGSSQDGGKYVGVLISLLLIPFSILLFVAQPNEFFVDGLKKVEQLSHKCVELRGEYVE